MGMAYVAAPLRDTVKFPGVRPTAAAALVVKSPAVKDANNNKNGKLNKIDLENAGEIRAPRIRGPHALANIC